MKTVTPELESLLEGGTFATCDIYTITLFGGGVHRFTNGQVDVAWDGETWSARGVAVDPAGSRSTARWKIGLDVDEWSVMVLPRLRDVISGAPYPDKIGGTPWVAAAVAGALDNADLLVQRAYFSAAPVYPLPPTGAVPVGIITLFAGFVGEVKCGDTTVQIKGLDYRARLSTRLPRNLHRASCRHTLFDAGCQLDAAAYKMTGVVAAGSTRSSIVSTIGAPPGSATYTLGRIVMTSGLNETFAVSVREWAGGVLSLLRPLPYNVTAGDTFDAFPGCDKTMATCRLFGNILNYGGEPYIPAPETAI